MSIPGSLTPLFSTGAGGAAGYQIERSLRFNSADSAYLSRTPAVAGNRRTWTWSGWVKRSALGANQTLLEAGDGSNYTLIWFGSNDKLQVLEDQGGGGIYYPYTTAVFRDVSAWYHIVVAIDTTQATSTNRIQIYVNGVQQAIDNSYPPQNLTTYVNSTNAHRIGYRVSNSAALSAYLADIHFIDGQALTPSSFTEVSATTGQLIPLAYTGTFGTNGFWLKFSDNSAATAATLGNDYSGNNNDWTPNNFQATVQTGRLYAQASGTSTSAFSSATLLGNFPATVGGSYAIYDADLITSTTSATFSYTQVFSAAVEVLVSADGTSWTSKGNQSSAYTTVTNASAFRYVRWFYSTFNFGINNNPAGNDSLVDSPTNYGTDTSGVGGEVRGNYATLNPLAGTTFGALSDGNLKHTASGGNFSRKISTIGVASGKWYAEFTFETAGDNTNQCGVLSFLPPVDANNQNGEENGSGIYNGDNAGNDGTIIINGTKVLTGQTVSGSGTIIGVTLDADSNNVKFYRNGTIIGSSSGYTPTNVSGTWYFVSHTKDDSSANVVNFGQRAFAYTAPSGFKALCDTNLGAPLVAKPSTVFNVITYAGTGATQTLPNANSTPSTPLAFSPDFIWTKSRSRVDSHGLHDIVRGRASNLYSDLTAAENTSSLSADLVSFDANGYTLGTVEQTAMNRSGETYVGWAWDAGTTTASNPDGSITSQVRANVSAGFSIVTYTGTGTSGQTIGHGLGVTPALVIIKNRTDADTLWQVHGNGFERLQLNTTQANLTDGYTLARTSTTISPTGNAATHSFWNASGKNYVAYCWSPVVGYSSFGSYTGNGLADGPFVFTGMRPRWVMLKCTGTTAYWFMYDTARDADNVVEYKLYPNDSAAENGVAGETLSTNVIDILSNGFKLRNANGSNFSSQPYIYAAFAENPFQYSRAR